MKFEEVYCATTDKLVTISEVTYVFVKDKKRFASDFNEKMYCPYCRKARLTFVNALRPHFRTYPDGDHAEDCIHKKEEMDASEVQKLHKSAAGENTIMRQIDRLAVQFLRSSVQPEKPAQQKKSLSQHAEPTKIKTKWQTDKFIPRKRIDTQLSEEDYETEKLFYGKVRIRWEASRTGTSMKLLIRSIETNRLICRLYLTESVYEHLPKKYTSIDECDFFLIFMASLRRQDEEKAWCQGNLIRSTYLRMEKMEDTGKKDL